MANATTSKQDDKASKREALNLAMSPDVCASLSEQLHALLELVADSRTFDKLSDAVRGTVLCIACEKADLLRYEITQYRLGQGAAA